MIDFSSNPLFLAPLAGLSDFPFRGIVKSCGCDVTISEMISANALIYQNEKTLNMLKKNPVESPYIVQLEGGDEEIIKQAVEILNDIEGIDGIDINCGCPVPKVIKQNAGSALLKNPEKIYKILEIIKKTSNKKYTSAKLRLGFDSVILPDIAKNLENSGADFISVHVRTKVGGFSAKPDYEILSKIKDDLKIPIIANGGINENNYKEAKRLSRADGLMIGMGAIGKPWIFSQIKTNKEPSNKEKKDIILIHFDKMLEYYGERGSNLFKKHLHEYSKGYEGASEFRSLINHSDSKQMKDLIKQFF